MERTEQLPFVASPDWGAGEKVSVERARAVFARDRVPLTLGVEEELMLVAPDSLELYDGIEGVLRLVGDGPPYRRELREVQLEIVTSICRSVPQAVAEVARARRQVSAACHGFVRLLAAGTHPTAMDWGTFSEGARYQLLEDEFSWAARRSMACGVHVHVALDDPDIALTVHNAARSYLPEIQALAANAPFAEGEDSGLATIRPKLNEALPRTGIPPPLSSWESYVAFLEWGRRGRLFPDHTHLWWDLRLHLTHGTIEVRVADAQTSLADLGAIVALVHCLIGWLAERARRGEQLTVHDSTRIAENAWRALRYGVQGELIDLDSGVVRPARARLAQLLVELEATAEALGCVDELTGCRALLAGNGADRQRYVVARDGIPGLLRWLVETTESSS